MNEHLDEKHLRDGISPWHSIGARLAMSVLGIAIGVFIVGLLVYIYFQEDKVKQETMLFAEMQLTEQVLEAEKILASDHGPNDSTRLDSALRVIGQLKPYKHAYCIVLDAQGRYMLHPDTGLVAFNKDTATAARKPTIFERALTTQDSALDSLGRKMLKGEKGMMEILKGKDYSMAVYRPLRPTSWSVAVICSRLDVFSSLISILWFAFLSVIVGIILMFILCFVAIRRITHPLEQLTESAIEIAKGNLNVELPEQKIQDEMWQLRQSFMHMQEALRLHIAELTRTTAANERIRSELSIARNIQHGMIPTSFQGIPNRPDIDIYASLLPAKEVGGDLYDYYLYNEKLCFIVGDVSGKGVPAALYMAMTMRVFRIACRHHINSAHEIAEAMGRTLAENNRSSMFITAFIGVLDLKTNLLGYCNAGHNEPLLVSPGGECTYLKAESNIPLGILESYDYEGHSMDFPPGSKLLVYTDGLTEAEDKDRQLFGEARLLGLLQDLGMHSAREIVNTLNLRVRQFADGTAQSDDLTILCLSKQTPKHTLRLSNKISEVSKLENFMEEVARDFGIPQKLRKSLNLAVEEAVVNVIAYAYPPGTEGDLELSASTAASGNGIVFTLIDQGKPFDPTSQKEADTTSGVEERQVGGLGIHLIRRIMDSMDYERQGDRNILSMRKSFETTVHIIN